jgi:hypothetical protein
MKQEYSILSITSFVFVLAIFAQFCTPLPVINYIATLPADPISFSCFLKELGIQEPELQTHSPVPHNSNTFAGNASGTASPSPSASVYDEYVS